MPEPVTKEEIAGAIDIAKALRATDPAEAARQLAYIPPADAARARKELGLESHAKDEADERRKIRVREVTPPVVLARTLPPLPPNVRTDQPGTWEELIGEAQRRGDTSVAARLREDAVREAVANIGKGYALRVVQVGSQLLPELSVRYSDDVLSVAWSRVGEADRNKWGPERLRRLSELVAWKVAMVEGPAKIPRWQEVTEQLRREADPTLPPLAVGATSPEYSEGGYYTSWDAYIRDAPDAAEMGRRHAKAVEDAIDKILVGYGGRPDFSLYYSEGVRRGAWSQVEAVEKARYGSETVTRGMATDTPPPFVPTRDEDRFTTLTAQVILMARAAAPYQVLDARNLYTAIVYGSRLADIDQDMRAAVGVLKALAVGTSLLLLPLGGAVSAALVRAGFSVGTAHFLGGLAMWRTFTLAHKLQKRGARALDLPMAAEKPYADLVDAVKDLVFAVPQIPGLAVFALIIADFMGYLDIPSPE